MRGAPAIYCADCGSECPIGLGREAGLRDPRAVDALVFACPHCTEAWAPIGPDGDAVGLPAGPDTRNARDLLRQRQVERLVAEALRENRNARPLAEERIAAFLRDALRLPLAEVAIDRLNVEWCREAWHALHLVSYADVVAHSQRYRPRKVA